MRHRYVPVVAVAGVMAGLAGCGSSSKVTSPTSVPVTSAATSSPSTGTGGSSGSTGSTGSTGKGTVGTMSSQYGTILESNGKALYLLTADSPTASKCTDSGCVAIWPPLTGTVTAGSGVSSTKLGHVSRPDGTQQATYGGHPLYFYIGDGGSAKTAGQGITSFGGTWWVVSASTGEAVTKPASGSAAGSTTTSTKPSSGYGAGY